MWMIDAFPRIAGDRVVRSTPRHLLQLLRITRACTVISEAAASMSLRSSGGVSSTAAAPRFSLQPT